MVYRPLRYEQMMNAAETYDVRARRMFNGMGIYTGEKMFAFLYESEIGLKLCPEDLDLIMKMPGSGILRPDPDGEPMREYVMLPRNVLDNYELFVSWVDRSVDHVKKKSQQQTVV